VEPKLDLFEMKQGAKFEIEETKADDEMSNDADSRDEQPMQFDNHDSDS